MKLNRHTIWPITIAAICILFIAALLAFMFYSFGMKVDLVEDNYYEKGIAYQQQIERIKRTAALSYDLTWQYDKTGQRLIFSIDPQIQPQSISGTIYFFRPSDKNLDKTIPLYFSQNGMQQISMNSFAKGLWRVKIYWRNDAGEYYNEGLLVIE